jgi:hypothetical protein
MKKSILVNKKARGRPKKAGGVDPVSAVRLPANLTKQVDAWGEAHTLSRSESIRRLVELGLTVKTKVAPSERFRAARSDRAKELAAKTIEKIIDPAAPPEERVERRRRLTKGPAEFRDARVDQPKAKGK